MERNRSSRSSGGDVAAVDVAAQIELEWPFHITHSIKFKTLSQAMRMEHSRTVDGSANLILPR